MIKCRFPNELIDEIYINFNVKPTEPTEGKIVFRIKSVICNVFLNTGTVNFQGKVDTEAKIIKEEILGFIEVLNEKD
ncbi:MAG: hypothetical protein AB8Y35_03220 [Coxiella endosymbiont of Dermacentor silvarum]